MKSIFFNFFDTHSIWSPERDGLWKLYENVSCTKYDRQLKSLPLDILKVYHFAHLKVYQGAVWCPESVPVGILRYATTVTALTWAAFFYCCETAAFKPITAWAVRHILAAQGEMRNSKSRLAAQRSCFFLLSPVSLTVAICPPKGIILSQNEPLPHLTMWHSVCLSARNSEDSKSWLTSMLTTGKFARVRRM